MPPGFHTYKQQMAWIKKMKGNGANTVQEADLKAQWNTDFRKDAYARAKNIQRTIKQQLNPKTPGLGNKAWKRADKEERENRKSTVSASLHEESDHLAQFSHHWAQFKLHDNLAHPRPGTIAYEHLPKRNQHEQEMNRHYKNLTTQQKNALRLSDLKELHDEPDRPGTGIGVSGDGTEKGMAMTEDGPSKKKTISKADWDHHTRHATAQFDTDGQRWIVQQDATGAAVRIPVTVTEDYPYRQTIRRILREAFPMAPKSTEKPDNTQDDEEKGEAPKVKKEKAVDPVVIGKTKDKFEADPVLTPVLSVANMPGGSVR